MSVLEFPARECRLWICACGCSTFELWDDGIGYCASCGEPTDCDGGSWYSEIKCGPDRDPDAEQPVRETQGNGSIDFARHSALRRASDPDAVMIASADPDGSCSIWVNAATADQKEWFLKRLEQMTEMVRNIRADEQ